MTEKTRYCWFCGDDLGCYSDYDPLDTCGRAECEREVRNQLAAEREEAHEQLDRDMGYGW